MILAVHWIGMHCFIIWLGGEAMIARGQSASVISSTDSGLAVNSNDSRREGDDGWRRTSKGWEYLPGKIDEPKAKLFLPTVHVSPAQVWPAAAAACMMLLIAVLPEKK